MNDNPKGCFWKQVTHKRKKIGDLVLLSAFTYSTVVCETAYAPITKTCLYNYDPLKPHFYIVKLGLQGYILFFLFLLKNIDCGYSLEPPRRGGSDEYHNICFEQKYEKISEFLSENFQFLVVKFSIYLNRQVFVMPPPSSNKLTNCFLRSIDLTISFLNFAGHVSDSEPVNILQSNLDSSNTDGSFTMANSNSFLSPYEVLPLAQENKYLGKFSYFIVKLYVVCTH